MKFVRQKATTSNSKYSPADFEDVKKRFLDEICQVVEMEEIPPELMLNWDQTGINLVPASGWMTEQQGSRRVQINGVNDKRQITAMLCGSLVGDFFTHAGHLQRED